MGHGDSWAHMVGPLKIQVPNNVWFTQDFLNADFEAEVVRVIFDKIE